MHLSNNGGRLWALLLPVLAMLAVAGCEGIGRRLFGTYAGPAPLAMDLVNERAIVRSIARVPAGEEQGRVSLVHLDRLTYNQPGRARNVNRLVALVRNSGGPSLDSLGLAIGDTVTVTTRYVGVTLSGPGPGLVPGWAGYDYLEYPIAGHALRSITK